MSTPAQAAASRANAQHSTGPRSPEGKATVSQNARKHGLSAKYLPLSDAERPLFDTLESSLRAEVNPRGALQESLFRDLVAAAWKRDIVNRLLAENTPSCESLFVPEIDDRTRKLLRHKADQDRAFHRALRQIKELQTTEMLRATLLRAAALHPAGPNPEEFPGLADFAKVTKQSRACGLKAVPSPAASAASLLAQVQASRQDLRQFYDSILQGPEPLVPPAA